MGVETPVRAPQVEGAAVADEVDVEDVLTRPLTYDDIKGLPEEDGGKRYELVGGELIVSPSPIAKHQKTSMNLSTPIDTHVRERDLGDLYAAPTDVVLSPHDTVVPDLFFVAKDRLGIVDDEGAVRGAPDLVIEIFSPSTMRRDLIGKAALYARAGVREYWQVDLWARKVRVLTLANGVFVPVEQPADRVRSLVLPELELTLAQIFGAR